MALRKPLVLVSGVPQQLQSGDQLDAQIAQTDVRLMLNAEASAALVFGAPVYVSASGSAKRAQANASATAAAVGLCADTSVAAGANANIAVSGVLTGSTALWDAVTGQTGGLTFGATYYVDPSNPGKITTTAPTTAGQYVMTVGRAMSTTDIEVHVSTLGPILL